jgi:hypothetical protein
LSFPAFFQPLFIHSEKFPFYILNKNIKEIDIKAVTANKVMTIAWLVDFAVGLDDSVYCLPDGQEEFLGKMFEEIQITEVL